MVNMFHKTNLTREKATLTNKWLSITLVVLLYDLTHAQLSDKNNGPRMMELMKRRSFSPKLKAALPPPAHDRLPRTTKVIVEKKPEWEGEKPRLTVNRTLLHVPSWTSVSDRDTLQDKHQGGCKDCYRKIKNLQDLCRFEFALRVRPIKKEKHRFLVQVLAVYRRSSGTELKTNMHIKLHLDKKEEVALSINKGLSQCSCPYLRPNVSYVVFGRSSRQQQGIVTAVRAHRVSSNITVSQRTDSMLRNLGSSCPPHTGPTQEVPNTSHSSMSLSRITEVVNSTVSDLHSTDTIALPTEKSQPPTNINKTE